MTDSKELNARARELIPGGVNSPVRSCRSVGAEPLFIRRGYGSKVVTEDGREMIDFVLSWGPLLLGHAHPEVLKAAHDALDNGSSFGAPCTGELDLAVTEPLHLVEEQITQPIMDEGARVKAETLGPVSLAATDNRRTRLGHRTKIGLLTGSRLILIELPVLERHNGYDAPLA